jgi:hypothetical protein
VDIHLRRDGFVLVLLTLMLVLLGAAVTGAYRVFGYGLVAFVGLMTGLGFMRRHDPVTWVPPLLTTAVLLIAFTGLFANEAAIVQGASDTILGFHPGTAFLVYGVWVPALFTLGVGFALLFDRVGADGASTADPTRGRR